MRKWSAEIIEKAKELRSQGCSYGQLLKELSVPKSTLHGWIKDVGSARRFTREDRIIQAKLIQPLAVLANRRKREEYFSQINTETDLEVNALQAPIAVQKAILSVLYWAEGSKGKTATVKFANTDPKLALLFVTLLRNCYQLDESKFRVTLHLHYYHKAGETKRFWSELLKIPISQFNKTYWKPRSKTKRFRKNFKGICFVGYNMVKLKDQMIAYGLATAKKISEG